VSADWRALVRQPEGTVAALLPPSGEAAGPIYAATAAGLRRSTDGGRRWERVGLDLPLGLEALERVELQGGELSQSGELLLVGGAGGLHGSSDNGRSWRPLLVGSRVLCLAAAPDAQGGATIFAGTEDDGVLRSTDGGQSWVSANPGLLDLIVTALALSPAFARDGTAYAATASGLYRTRNGGRAWRALDLPLDEAAIQCLELVPGEGGGCLYVGTERNGLLHSEDGGRTWGEAPELSGQSVTALAVRADSNGSWRVAASTPMAMLVRRGSEEWRQIEHELGPALALAFRPGDESLLVGLQGRGVALVDPSAGTVGLSNDGLAANLVVGLCSASDGRLAVASLEAGIAISADGGSSWRESELPDTAGAPFAVAFPEADGVWPALVAATGGGLLLSPDDGGWEPVGHEVGARHPRCLAARSGGPLLAGFADGAVARSDDAGRSWRRLATPLQGAEVVALASSPAIAIDHTLFVATVRPAESEGEWQLALWRSTDDGASWSCWLERTGPRALALLVPPSHPRDGALLVSVGDRLMRPNPRMEEIVRGQRRPHWREVWSAPDGALITSLIVVPESDLFAATTRGVYRSVNGGDSFEPCSEGLEPGPIVSLALAPDGALLALQLGGTVWERRHRT
jgi:photosystem II stability/assembly factor-like uncharacterized protein